jgi:hypothetical protein
LESFWRAGHAVERGRAVVIVFQRLAAVRYAELGIPQQPVLERQPTLQCAREQCAALQRAQPAA